MFFFDSNDYGLKIHSIELFFVSEQNINFCLQVFRLWLVKLISCFVFCVLFNKWCRISISSIKLGDDMFSYRDDAFVVVSRIELWTLWTHWKIKDTVEMRVKGVYGEMRFSLSLLSDLNQLDIKLNLYVCVCCFSLYHRLSTTQWVDFDNLLNLDTIRRLMKLEQHFFLKTSEIEWIIYSNIYIFNILYIVVYTRYIIPQRHASQLLIN